MKDLPENELLSTYLDGELTAAEQAEVEQLLARSPAARQLLEELRALSSKLQALPQHKLGEDLSQHVLQVAQRRMLTTSAPPGELPRPAPPTRRAILRRLVNSRALVWSSLAVAVAVILTVINPNQPERPAGDGIAKAPAPEEKRAAAPAIEAATKEGNLRRDLPDTASGDTSGQMEESRKSGSRSAADEYRAKGGGSDLAETNHSAVLPQGAVQGKWHVKEKVPAIRGGPIAKGAAGSPPVQWDLLVQCQISPEAHGKEVFDKALADNRIVWDETPASAGLLTGNAAVLQDQRRGQVGQQKPGDQRPTEVVLPEKVLLVYVEAPLVQVNGLLMALEAQPEAFSFISPEPPAAGETPKRPGRNLGGGVESQEAGGTGVLRGFGARALVVEPPAAPPEQRAGGGYEGQDNLGPRAYARRIQLPMPGLDLSAKSSNGGTDLPHAVVLGLRSSQPHTPEPLVLKGAPAPPGGPPEPRPIPPQEQVSQEETLAKLGRGTGVPMVRALFVLHLADLRSRAASVEAKPDTGKAPPEGDKAPPSPAAQE
jgi:hypothetical protein